MSETIAEKLLHSKKYKDVCPDTVRRICNEYTGRYKKEKDTEKAVREALHGITGAFISHEDKTACLELLKEWSTTRDNAILEKVLSCHVSTRERLPLNNADSIIQAIFAGMKEGFRVLDLACGIDPILLASRGIRADGMDISGEAVDLINEAGKIEGMECTAVLGDLLCDAVFDDSAYDAVLLFKILPLLERQRKGSAKSLLTRLKADRLIISFPTRTIGGRNVGMENHYAQWMDGHIPENRRIARTLTIGNELFYILEFSE